MDIDHVSMTGIFAHILIKISISKQIVKIHSNKNI